MPGTVLVDKSHLIKSCCQLYEIILLGRFYRRNQSSKRCFNVFKGTWLLWARAGIWIRFFDFTSSPEVPPLELHSPPSLHVLTSNFPLSSLPLLLPPPTGLHLPGPQMPSSQVICFAKILFWFDKLWPGQLTQHDSARENSEAACLAYPSSELRQNGRRRNLSLTDGSTRLSPRARCQGQRSLSAGGWVGARSCDSHMRGCVCVPVVTYGACVGQAVCHPGRIFVCGRFVCPCVSVCMQMNGYVCAWLRVSGCACCVYAEVCVHLNFEFAFILVCVLKNVKCWEGQRERERGRSYALRSQPFERPCLRWRAPAHSPLQLSPHPRTEWHELQSSHSPWEVIPFPRWSLSSELSFRFLKTTSWLRFLSKVDVLKFLWIRPPLKIC